MELPELTHPVKGMDAPILTAEVKYFDLISKQFVAINDELCVSRPAETDITKPRKVNETVFDELTRVMTAAAIQESKKFADCGNLQGATEILRRATVGFENMNKKHFGGKFKSPIFEQCCDDMEECSKNIENCVRLPSQGKYISANYAQAHAMKSSNITCKSEMIASGARKINYRGKAKKKLDERIQESNWNE